VKIFKTTLNEFKNRQRYVEGEHRFRHQHKRQNPRRLIKLWAEKEMRNLKRALAVGVKCPEPVLLKKHILMLQFIGRDGKAAPKLRDADLSAAQLESAYSQCVATMLSLYQKCSLVHCDLSEYNLLWLKGELWLIDLAQGVDREHPNAFVFLQRDCKSVSDYFRSKGVSGVLSVRQLFEYLTQNFDGADALEKLASLRAACVAANDPNPDANDSVWMQSFIPQSLSDLPDPELAHSLDSRDRFHDNLMRDTGSSDDDEDDESGTESALVAVNREQLQQQQEQTGPVRVAKPVVDKAQRKAAKKAVKLEQRNRRANKNGHVE